MSNNNQPTEENENSFTSQDESANSTEQVEASSSDKTNTLPHYLQDKRIIFIAAPFLLLAIFIFNQQFGGPTGANCDSMRQAQEYLDSRVNAVDIGIIGFDKFINQWDSGVDDVLSIANELSGDAQKDARQIASDASSVSLALLLGSGYASDSYSDMTWGFEAFFATYCE